MTGLDDEVLDLAEAACATPGGHEELTGEAALLAALDAGRTGRMSDIVETIQAEQDRIIRADLPRRAGRPGWPGHRQDRRRAAPGGVPALHAPRSSWPRRGVLIVGPNATFLRYISQVLPSLAETGVLLCTPGRPVPGRHAPAREEPAETAAVKGRPSWPRCWPPRCATGSGCPTTSLEIDAGRGDAAARTGPPAPPRGPAPAGPAGAHNLARPLVRHADRGRPRRPGRRAASATADPLGGDAPRATCSSAADLAEIRRELREPTRRCSPRWTGCGRC